MRIVLTRPAEKQFKKLHPVIKKKFIKQIAFLEVNPKHASLEIKKMVHSSLYEARIDRQYRFRFAWETDRILITSIGPHDEGLGKK